MRALPPSSHAPQRASPAPGVDPGAAGATAAIAVRWGQALVGTAAVVGVVLVGPRTVKVKVKVKVKAHGAGGGVGRGDAGGQPGT